MNRESIVTNLNKHLEDLNLWARKLNEFDKAEAEKAKEVFVWLPKGEEIKKVRINSPKMMEECLSKGINSRYGLDNLEKTWIYASHEGITWFRSEAAALEAQEKAKEVYVWLLVDGGLEKVKVRWPEILDKLIIYPTTDYYLYPNIIIRGETEGATWFRSEAAAQEAQAEEPDCLISLREAKEMVYSAHRARERLDRLPRYPIPQGKMVPLEVILRQLHQDGYPIAAIRLREHFKKADKD